MKKTRLALIITSIIFYLLSLGFFIYSSIGISFSSDDIANTIGSILFLIISLGVGSIMFFIPFIISLTSLILTIKLNNNGGSYSKLLPIIFTILPVITEVVLVLVVILIM